MINHAPTKNGGFLLLFNTFEPRSKSDKESMKNFATTKFLCLILSIYATIPLYDCRADNGKKYEENFTVLMLILTPSHGEKEALKNEIIKTSKNLPLNLKFKEEDSSIHSPLEPFPALFSNIASSVKANFVIAIEQKQSGIINIIVYDSVKNSMLVREIATKNQKSPILLETVSIVVKNYLNSISEGGHIGIHTEKQTITEPSKESESSSKKVEKSSLTLLASYRLDTHSPQQPVINGLCIGVGFSPLFTKPFEFEFMYKLSPSFYLSDERVLLETSIHPFVFGFRANFRKKFFQLSPGSGVTLGLIRRHFHSLNSSSAVEEKKGSLAVSISPSIRMNFTITQNLEFFIQSGMEIYVLRVPWEYSSNGKTFSIATPWYSGFNILAGITVNLLGTPENETKIH